MVGIEQLQRLVGTDLPTGEYTVVPHEHWLTCDVVGAPPRLDGPAHPMYAFYATLVGMGLTLSELFAMFEVADDDGVMAGETTMRTFHPMWIGATYAIPATILGIERKHGVRLGTFDLMRFRADVVDADGVTVATVDNSFVFPRR